MQIIVIEVAKFCNMALQLSLTVWCARATEKAIRN